MSIQNRSTSDQNLSASQADALADWIAPAFPFSAVEGQSSFKKALLYAAINPAIGGVLVSGPRGSAKSTLARALADILPPLGANSEYSPSPFVTLPLGASEEMLSGSLDIDQVLTEQRLAFSPGLLSKAHGGVLYVDEVNLLPDLLVDQLLDVAASGVNRVERDGISHAHEAQFSLIGTMNPDEGEIRPQLLDRFGLMVELQPVLSLQERVSIVKSREAFDQSPDGFLQQYQSQQDALRQRIKQAKIRLPDIFCSDALRLEIAERCHRAGVEGVRADIVMYRAALAAAAWRGALEITVQDIDDVCDLVLAHRRRDASGSSDQAAGPDQDDSGGDGSDSAQGSSKTDSQPDNGGTTSRNNARSAGFTRPQPPASRRRSDTEVNGSGASVSSGASANSDASANSEESEESPKGSGEADWGGMPPQPAQKSATRFNIRCIHLLQQLLQAGTVRDKVIEKKVMSRANHFKNIAAWPEITTRRNPLVPRIASQNNHFNRRAKQGKSTSQQRSKIAWFKTLSASVKTWPKIDIRLKKQHVSSDMLHLVLLDTSASTLSHQLSDIAKACVLDIAQYAYLQRDKLQVLGFGQGGTQVVFQQNKAPKHLQQMLEQLEIGGGTPLRDVLLKAQDIIASLNRHASLQKIRCYLVTDGRSRAQVQDIVLNTETVLIDTESSVVKRGRGAALAEQLGAYYLPLTTDMLPQS